MQNTMKTMFTIYLVILSFFSSATESLESITEKLSLKNANSYQQRYITGGQPSIKDLEALATANVKMVINLRGTSEFSDFDEQAVVERLGMSYVSLPIANSDALNPSNIKKFHHLINSTNSSVLVHCASGNRVGAFFALEAHQFGNKSKVESLAIGKQTGLTRLEDQVVNLIDSTILDNASVESNKEK